MNTAARQVWARGAPFVIDEVKRTRTVDRSVAAILLDALEKALVRHPLMPRSHPVSLPSVTGSLLDAGGNTAADILTLVCVWAERGGSLMFHPEKGTRMTLTWRYVVRPDGDFYRMPDIDGSLDTTSDAELARLWSLVPAWTRTIRRSGLAPAVGPDFCCSGTAGS
ncbi:hypothetical protein ACIP5U_28100 [Streptomyces sp. NPDC088788]|uniref:hypothetical protein n=1 Tax=Streptomyces sp. NPDC088788 TaxID=3365898 RepID=UPI0038272FFF